MKINKNKRKSLFKRLVKETFSVLLGTFNVRSYNTKNNSNEVAYFTAIFVADP